MHPTPFSIVLSAASNLASHYYYYRRITTSASKATIKQVKEAVELFA